MSEPTVTATSPISEWNPALQAIVRCLEAIDASQPVHEKSDWWRNPNGGRYQALIECIEGFLIIESQRDSWGMDALAELAIQDSFEPKLIPLERGIPYLFKAADGGYLNAQLELARLADHGDIPPSDFWPITNESPHIDRQRWDEFNQQQSIYWWKAAAENGSADAQFHMSEGLIESDLPDAFAKGLDWLERAARGRTPSSDAQHKLACLMESGRIDPGSPQDRWTLYEAAANGEVPSAMLAAGYYLEHGIGVERNVDAARKWYLDATDVGNSAEEGLGYLLAALCTSSVSSSNSFFESASKAGNVEAMIERAAIELNEADGHFDTSWFKSALNWYEQAAEKNCREAVIALAELYEQGWYGCYSRGWRAVYGDDWESETLEVALAYYRKAQGLGYEDAADSIDEIEERLRGLVEVDLDEDDLESEEPE